MNGLQASGRVVEASGLQGHSLGTLGEARGEGGDVESRIALQTAPPATSQRATSHSSQRSERAEGAHCSVQDRLVRARASGMGGAKLLCARFLPPNRMSRTSTNHPANQMGSQRGEVGEVGQCRGNCAAESIVAQIHLLQTQHVAQLGRLDPIPPTC